MLDGELLENPVRWDVHPKRIVTHRFTLDQADEAFRITDKGAAGKVCTVFE
jgi:threonine dehydrogenase-like Zn-dependent dehydrogenase